MWPTTHTALSKLVPFVQDRSQKYYKSDRYCQREKTQYIYFPPRFSFPKDSFRIGFEFDLNLWHCCHVTPTYWKSKSSWFEWNMCTKNYCSLLFTFFLPQSDHCLVTESLSQFLLLLLWPWRVKIRATSPCLTAVVSFDSRGFTRHFLHKYLSHVWVESHLSESNLSKKGDQKSAYLRRIPLRDKSA